jgi:hypothetical protein
MDDAMKKWLLMVMLSCMTATMLLGCASSEKPKPPPGPDAGPVENMEERPGDPPPQPE